MLKLVLTGIRQMEAIEVPMPVISSPTDVLIRVKAVGVCGSDVHYYTSGKIGSQIVKYPFAVGHEGAGIVEAVGTGVTLVKVGDRIAIEPAMPCLECDQCRDGRFHTCRKMRFLGCPAQAEGCLSEYIVMPEKSCLPIADTLTYEQAAISEPLAIGVYAAKLSQVQAHHTVCILGSGPIGLSVLSAVKALGVQNVYVTDKIDARLRLARQTGAIWTGNVLKEDVVKSILDAQLPRPDFVFECCGQQEALDQALELLKPGGKLMIIGIPAFDCFSFAVDTMRHKEIAIQNVRRQNLCTEPTLRMLENHQIEVDHWVTHRFDLKDTKKAFDLVANYEDGVMKAMIMC